MIWPSAAGQAAVGVATIDEELELDETGPPYPSATGVLVVEALRLLELELDIAGIMLLDMNEETIVLEYVDDGIILELELAVEEAIAFALEVDEPGEPYPGAAGALDVEAIMLLDETGEPYPGATGALVVEAIILLDVGFGIELAMELAIAVLDIAIVNGLPPLQVPNIGLQLPVPQ